ncbi:MAG: DNA/RNA nuclease SfsA [Deltaproteobacteria bacterium]|nr:DNA/RNA nuclease SfsA [Deltaproteobacteria bacterium]
MPFPEPRLLATFLGRRQRFFADVRLADGTETAAHCPNTGSMRGCLYPGHRALLWDSRNPARRLRYTWKAVEAEGFWIGVDTAVPNRLVETCVRAGVIPRLSGFPNVRREQRMGERSRVDLLLDGPAGRCYVEVKNVTLVENGVARFPDAVTERGLRHLTELRQRVEEGHRAAMVYVVQREDGRAFEPAEEIDPAYARGLRTAVAAGVEAYVVSARVTPEEVRFHGLLPARL